MGALSLSPRDLAGSPISPPGAQPWPLSNAPPTPWLCLRPPLAPFPVPPALASLASCGSFSAWAPESLQPAPGLPLCLPTPSPCAWLPLSLVAPRLLFTDLWEVPFEEILDLQWVGSGAQGAVFLGRFHGEEVAVKKVRDLKETDIKHLRKLKHPNIITFK